MTIINEFDMPAPRWLRTYPHGPYRFINREFFIITYETDSKLLEAEKKRINSFLVEIHKKYSIPVACLVFVLLGAPLGIMAKRGGMVIALSLSLGFFILYWAFLIAGEELADRQIISAFWAMWSANFLIGIAGLFLFIKTYKEAKFISWGWLEKIVPKRLRKYILP